MMLLIGSRAALTSVAVAVLVTDASALRGQGPTGEIGSRLRVSVADRPQLVGTVLGRRDSTLYLQLASNAHGVPDTIGIAQAAIRTVEVSHGTRGHVLTGMLIGGAAGAGLGAAVACHNCFGGPVAGAILGGGSGLLIGGVIGALTRSERWVSITPNDVGRSTTERSAQTVLRVTVADRREPLVGTSLGSRDAKLYLVQGSPRRGAPDTIAIDQSTIQHVEVRDGTNGHTLAGMLIGGAAGAGLGAAADRVPSAGVIIGGGSGLLIGGVIGTLIRTDRWTPITPTIAWQSAPGRGARMLSLGVHIPW
jgi:hypothetical protein